MANQCHNQSFISSKYYAANIFCRYLKYFYADCCVVAELSSSFGEHLSKSLDVGGGVWPMAQGAQQSPANTRRMSLQTSSLQTSSSSLLTHQTFPSSFSSGSYGGSAGAKPPSEKECRQVFFDCALQGGRQRVVQVDDIAPSLCRIHIYLLHCSPILIFTHYLYYLPILIKSMLSFSFKHYYLEPNQICTSVQPESRIQKEF